MTRTSVGAYGALVPPSPHGVRAAVGKVLHTGVLASGAILLTGYVVGLARESATFRSAATEQAHLAGKATYPHSFVAVWDGLAHGSSEAIIVAAMLMLILTPVAGLLTAAVAFARRGDWLFTAISAIVLAVICASFLLGALAR